MVLCLVAQARAGLDAAGGRIVNVATPNDYNDATTKYYVDNIGGPNGAPGHGFLSTAHTDTTTDAATRGSIIYGNSTPKWDELDLGAAGTVLRSDGTDCGWSATTNITELGTITTGTWQATAIDHERGGLEADVSSYSGLLAISGGATSEIDALSELEGQIADVTAFVVEGTACSDIEGTALTITAGTLNVDDVFLRNDASDETSGTLTASGFTDGTATLSGGNITGMGNITGSDVDIEVGTGDYNGTGYIDLGAEGTFKGKAFENSADSTDTVYFGNTGVFVRHTGVTGIKVFYDGKNSALTLNPDTEDLDILISAWQQANLFKMDAGNKEVYIGDGGSSNYSEFTATGNLTLYGSAVLDVTTDANFGGDITVSNITASATVQAEQLTSTDDITMQGHLFTLGNNTAADVVLSFDCSNDATITYDESEDYFKCSDDIFLNSNERIYFYDTGLYINSNNDGYLDYTANTHRFNPVGVGNDIPFAFNGQSNDGILTWMQASDYFKFSDDVMLNTTEKLYFRDNAIYLYSNIDGYLNICFDGGLSVNGISTWSGTFTNGDGDTVTVTNGLITDVASP